VDAVIHPSTAGQLAVEARYPSLAARPHSVVAHGHFRGAYPDTVARDEARRALGIPAGARVITFIGKVRRYKNVPHLVRTVRTLPPRAGEVILLVAGASQTQALAEEVLAAAGADPRVRLRLDHIPEAEVQRYLRAADLVVLPFTEITNSGSALLALSFERPVLVPALGAMGELQALVGREWVCTYEGELMPDVLTDALQWAARQRNAAPGLDQLEWPLLARQTLSVYAGIVRRR
jgi:glycosyltransferase involved in cell wall biosynthesis